MVDWWEPGDRIFARGKPKEGAMTKGVVALHGKLQGRPAKCIPRGELWDGVRDTA